MEGIVAINTRRTITIFYRNESISFAGVHTKQVCAIDWWVHCVYDATVLLLEALYDALQNNDDISYPFSFTPLDDEYQIGFTGQDAVVLYGFDDGHIIREYIANITASVTKSRGSLTGSFALNGGNTRVEGFELVNLQGDSWLSVATILSTTCSDYTDCECGNSGYGSCCLETYCRSNEWNFFADSTWTINLLRA